MMVWFLFVFITIKGEKMKKEILLVIFGLSIIVCSMVAFGIIKGLPIGGIIAIVLLALDVIINDKD